MKLISIAFDMDADIQKDLMNPKPKKTEERVEEIAISKKGMIFTSLIFKIQSKKMSKDVDKTSTFDDFCLCF